MGYWVKDVCQVKGFLEDQELIEWGVSAEETREVKEDDGKIYFHLQHQELVRLPSSRTARCGVPKCLAHSTAKERGTLALEPDFLGPIPAYLFIPLSLHSALCKMEHLTTKPVSQAFREDLIIQTVHVKHLAESLPHSKHTINVHGRCCPPQSTPELACPGDKIHKESAVFKWIYFPNSGQT